MYRYKVTRTGGKSEKNMVLEVSFDVSLSLSPSQSFASLHKTESGFHGNTLEAPES